MPQSMEIAKWILRDGFRDNRCAVSFFARLVRISACRDLYSQIYSYPAPPDFTAEDINDTLRVIHERAFVLWRQRSLREQLSDIDALFEHSDAIAATVMEYWVLADLARSLVPNSAEEIDQQLFAHDLRVVVACGLPRLTKSRPPADRRILSVLQLIRESPMKMTIRSLAGGFHVSEKYLGRMFMEEVGLTFHQYTTIMRLRAASELLSHSRSPIKGLAAD